MEPQGSKQHGGVVNMTRAMEALSPWLNNPRRTITKVEVLVVLAAALLLLQLILGCCRRRWHSSAVHSVLRLSAKLMNPLVIYTLGTMQSSPIKNSSYPVWATVLIMASAGTSAFRQYDFYDNFDNKKMQVVADYAQDAFYTMMLVLLMDPNTYTWKTAWDLKRRLKSSRPSSRCVVALICVVLVTKLIGSISLVLLGYKNKPRPFIKKMLSRCRTQAAERRTEETAPDDGRACDHDPQSMKGYSYAVYDYLSRLITIDQIWDCCGSSADDGNALKDLCLSCALFRRLVGQRYFGEFEPETGLVNKDHDLVFKNLLKSERGFKRAFRIIEVELGFCYDFFFTKYHYTFVWMNLPVPFIQSLILLKMILISIVGVFTIRKSLVLETPKPIIEVHISKGDYTITLLVLFIGFIVELAQAMVYLASNWAQVSLACMYVKKYWCDQPIAFVIGKVIGILRRFMISGALRNKIDQHSVIFQWKQQQPDPVEVSDAVKKAVARSLISTHGNSDLTTDGETSVVSSRQKQMFVDEHYSWALKDLSRLEVMLIWHIATEYCDVIPDDPSSGSHRGEATHLCGYVLQLLRCPNRRNGIITQDGHRGVAVHLSRYCTYLIRYVPELLPYPEVDVPELAQKVMKEAQKVKEEHEELFGSYNYYTLPEIYNRLKNLHGTEEEDDPRMMFQKGVKLGKQLERLPDGNRWEVLEDFWAKTIIHAAASHYTTKKHMQHLEKGGEFLTHIWALLSHAGIPNFNKPG